MPEEHMPRQQRFRATGTAAVSVFSRPLQTRQIRRAPHLDAPLDLYNNVHIRAFLVRLCSSVQLARS